MGWKFVEEVLFSMLPATDYLKQMHFNIILMDQTFKHSISAMYERR